MTQCLPVLSSTIRWHCPPDSRSFVPGTAYTPVTVPSAANPQLPKVLNLKPRVGQNYTASFACFAHCRKFCCLTSAVPVHSTSLFPYLKHMWHEQWIRLYLVIWRFVLRPDTTFVTGWVLAIENQSVSLLFWNWFLSFTHFCGERRGGGGFSYRVRHQEERKSRSNVFYLAGECVVEQIPLTLFPGDFVFTLCRRRFPVWPVRNALFCLQTTQQPRTPISRNYSPLCFQCVVNSHRRVSS